jgi:hypothetical protein
LAAHSLVVKAKRLERDEHLYRQIEALREETQILLKVEWERVKKGEDNYVQALRYSCFLFVACVVLLLCWGVIAIISYLVSQLPELFKG